MSLDTEESHADNSDESHVVDIEDANPGALSSEGPTEADMLLEEPELENVTEIDIESSGDDLDDDRKCESRRSINDMTDVELQEHNSIIISEDSQTIINETTVHDTLKQMDNGKYETTLYTEDDEV